MFYLQVFALIGLLIFSEVTFLQSCGMSHLQATTEIVTKILHFSNFQIEKQDRTEVVEQIILGFVCVSADGLDAS